jgi:hypothetical protein
MLLSALAPSVLLSSALAADFLQVDAAAPGMAVAVTLLREGGGFTGSEVLTSSCGDLVLGPALANDVVDQVDGFVLDAFVLPVRVVLPQVPEGADRRLVALDRTRILLLPEEFVALLLELGRPGEPRADG